jgi:internalin A
LRSRTEVKYLSPLGGLTALQALDCCETPVSDLTPLAGLTALQALNCRATPVRDLSPLADLIALQALNCRGTPVRVLSPLADLIALQALNCAGTPVNDLSPLAGLTALQSLDCAMTPVSDLTPLVGLPGLQWLDCYNCSLTHIPEGLLNKPSLEKLYFLETKIPGIPAEVLSSSVYDNCLESLRAHLRDLKSGAAAIADAKLMVLGNGLIGKTQICNRLRGEAYNKNVSSTHGIVVKSALLPQPNGGQPAQLHLWDFGGQDIYHGTHALFMRTKAIFLLVWTPETDRVSEYEHGGMIFRNQPLSYWLAYIRHLSGLDSPVLVVQTRCDRPEDEVRRLPVSDEALKGFGFCKPLQYSSLNNRGRAALDEALREALSWLWEQQGTALIGVGRLRVKQRLEALRDADAAVPPEQRQYRTLSQEHFRQLCAEGSGDVSSPEYLLDYLHNAGVVFYRQGLFDDRMILDQGWALEAVYAVFHREKCYKQLRQLCGRFTRSLLELLVWRDYRTDEQELFLGMMQSCGICFIHRKGDPANSTEDEYIAPDLLPDKSGVVTELEEK